MADSMENVQGQGPGTGPLSAQDRKLYEQEYKHGLDLFQRALDQYASAGEVHKKEAFKDVMDKAMQVLNETARGLKRPDLLQQNNKIEHDYQAYQSTEDDPEKNKLITDLNQAKKNIG